MPDKYGPISSGVPTQAVGTRDQPDVGAAEDARIEMQKAAACDQFLLRQKDDCIRDQKVLIEECRHRLLNCLQMVVALLSLQSRKEEDGAAAKALAKAADRVQVIAGLHHHLHSMDGAQMVEFKSFLDRLCRDHSAMLTPDTQLGAFIVVAGVELDVPATIGLPLSLIANELVTNAIKHGGGPITVTLAAAGERHALSVSNPGSAPPEDFDCTAAKGLGMKLVTSLTRQIGGELRIDRGDGNDGTRFTVVFG